VLEYVSWIAYALLVYATGRVIERDGVSVLVPYCMKGCVRPPTCTDDVKSVLVYTSLKILDRFGKLTKVVLNTSMSPIRLDVI